MVCTIQTPLSLRWQYHLEIWLNHQHSFIIELKVLDVSMRYLMLFLILDVNQQYITSMSNRSLKNPQVHTLSKRTIDLCSEPDNSDKYISNSRPAYLSLNMRGSDHDSTSRQSSVEPETIQSAKKLLELSQKVTTGYNSKCPYTQLSNLLSI